ncbi:AbiV family abortive infection protein [Heyndrickxia camelliae]|nr:AbiV family abortive infection protein [Heyndrickxia camelliae]
MSFNQLKVEDIEKIFYKINENACELLEEAELLYNHEKYARAYLCAHIAFEEFGKLPILYSVALDIHFGKKVNWKKLNKDIRDHQTKISQSYVSMLLILFKFMKVKGYTEFKFSLITNSYDEIMDFLDETNFSYSEAIEELYLDAENQKQINMIPAVADLLNGFKNSSLYADFHDGIFYKPSERIDKDICGFGITLAKIQKKYHQLPDFDKEGFGFNELTQEIEYSNALKQFLESVDELEELQKQK